MITVERVAEVIRKYQRLTELETDSNKKKLMAVTLMGMEREYQRILEENVPCPPEIEEELDKYLSKIEDDYAKACN